MPVNEQNGWSDGACYCYPEAEAPRCAACGFVVRNKLARFCADCGTPIKWGSAPHPRLVKTLLPKLQVKLMDQACGNAAMTLNNANLSHTIQDCMQLLEASLSLPTYAFLFFVVCFFVTKKKSQSEMEGRGDSVVCTWPAAWQDSRLPCGSTTRSPQAAV